MSVITAEGLTKVFGKQVSVDDLSFAVEAGRVTGFLGPNGAGKTTTLRMILGLALPTSGVARVFGSSYRELRSPSRTVGCLLDASHFHPLRSGRGHLKVLAASAGIPDRRVDEVLDLVELQDAAGKKVGHYSLGMRQRLGLASALLGDPPLLVLDEPANGLDPSGIRWLRGFLRTFVEDGRAVLVSSHLLDEIAHVADDVVVINRGRLVRSGTVRNLLAGPGANVRVRTSDPRRLATALTAKNISVQWGSDGDLVASAPGEKVGQVALHAGLPLSALMPESVTLEDIFLQLTEHKEGG